MMQQKLHFANRTSRIPSWPDSSDITIVIQERDPCQTV